MFVVDELKSLMLCFRRLADFEKFPDIKVRGVRALYDDQPHQSREDGLRFKKQADLWQHTESLIEKKKLLKKKSDKKEPQYREWNCSLDQWITNFNTLTLKGGEVVGPAVGALDGAKVNAQVADTVEEFVLPADENFLRCPISNEVFQQGWDYEEGEYLFHNAVKVFVTTECTDQNILRVARPVQVSSEDGSSHIEIPGLKYFIVHKLLVMDRWLQEGKASTLSQLLQHLDQHQKRSDLADILLRAADGEDEGDIFVILDESMR